MIRPGRLFLKLFLAFWLATSLTFFVGLGIVMSTRLAPGTPQLNDLLDNQRQLLERFGLEAARPLLALWTQPQGQQVGLYAGDGRLLAGVAVEAPAYAQAITSLEGQHLVLRSSHALSQVGGPGPGDDGPGPTIPLLVGAVLSALFSAYLAHYLAWPLLHLRGAMSRVAQGRFDTRVKPMMGARRDEIVDLAQDCDRMARQLKLLVDAQQQLLHDISHELRSPLTRMRAAIGLLRQSPGREEMLVRVERESERIDSLIEELLTLARLQGRPGSIESERLDVVELLVAIVDDAQFEAARKGCQVRLQGAEPFISQVSGELLYRCFENVIRNAVRYTAAGSCVEVVARVDSDGLLVTIVDRGPGVEEARLESIFQPFERGLDDATVGFGLGLAIAQRAVQMHGGSIAARNSDPVGLCVEIRVPRMKGSLHDIT